MARQPQLAQAYLPSTLSGVRYYQTSNKSITSLGQEWDRLGREARAAEELYTATSPLSQQMSMLMQPAQASRIAALPVPQIQPQELHLKNAGTALSDQAMAQNLIIFGERECEKKQQSVSDEVTALASMIGKTVPTAPKPTDELRQVDANMDTGEKSESKMVGEAEAQQAGSSGLATEDVSKA